MCLSVAVARPNDVLGAGKHAGHEWMIVHNGRGFRCGYVKVEPGHPWHGQGYGLLNETVNVHGGLTFARADQPCDNGGPDDGWWIGFDCGHGFDAPDPALPNERNDMLGDFFRAMSDAFDGKTGDEPTVRTQEYVEAECRKLCEQAAAAAVAV